MAENIVEMADKVIQSLPKDRRGNIALKTSQIRKFLAAVNSLSNRVVIYKIRHPKEELSDELAGEIQYLQVMLAYQCGRRETGKDVKPFVEQAELMPRIKAIGKDRKKFEQFARYVEALVAYHKYHGGRD